MSIGRSLRQHDATLRVVMLCLLLGALAFAPVARAVCDIEHVAALAGGAGLDGPLGAIATRQPAQHDTCCDISVTSMIADLLPSAGKALTWMPVGLAQASIWQGPNVSQRRSARAGGRLALQPPEPVFRRVRKLLI